MSKKRQDNKSKTSSKEKHSTTRQAWIPEKSGLRIIGITSIVLAVWVGYQITREGQFWQGVLWGGAFGVSIWLIYFGMNWFHSLFQNKRE